MPSANDDLRVSLISPFRVATQIIPLPEAADYKIKIREKVEETRKVQTKRNEIFKRFWAQFIELSGQRGRSHQIAEHDSELTALGFGNDESSSSGACRG